MKQDNLLAVLAAVYRGGAETFQGLEPEAFATLKSLGYIDERGGKSGASDEIAQRGLVLSLLEKVEASFLKTSPLGDRAYLAGAVLAPASLDLSWGKPHPISAGGRGLTPMQAIESCAGELSERLAIYDFGGRRAGKSVAVDLITGDLRPIDPTKIFRSTEGQSKSPSSEGCGSGASLQDAVESGLLELVERDAVALWWRGGQRGAPARFGAAALQAVFGDDQSRSRWLLDVTTDIGTPVMVAISCDQKGGGVVVGAAGGWTERAASMKAALELAQMEVAAMMSLMKVERLGRKNLLPGDEQWLDRLQKHSVNECALFSPNGGSRRRTGEAGSWSALLRRLRKLNDSPDFIDITMSEIGMPCVRVRSAVLQPMATPDARIRLEDVHSKGSPCLPPDGWPTPI